jgi:hypothetical protein
VPKTRRIVGLVMRTRSSTTSPLKTTFTALGTVARFVPAQALCSQVLVTGHTSGHLQLGVS